MVKGVSESCNRELKSFPLLIHHDFAFFLVLVLKVARTKTKQEILTQKTRPILNLEIEKKP